MTIYIIHNHSGWYIGKCDFNTFITKQYFNAYYSGKDWLHYCKKRYITFREAVQVLKKYIAKSKEK